MRNQELAKSITAVYDEISKVFGEFQNKGGFSCPSGCGKCCFKPDIFCAPYELLPLALSLLDVGKAEIYLEKSRASQNERCLFLEITDEAKGLGRCLEYQYRPFICRIFGVSARHGKNEKIDYSICRVLKEGNDFFSKFSFVEEEIPFIEIWKKRIEALDPRLMEKEIPINQALMIVLEKVLLWNSYKEAIDEKCP